MEKPKGINCGNCGFLRKNMQGDSFFDANLCIFGIYIYRKSKDSVCSFHPDFPKEILTGEKVDS